MSYKRHAPHTEQPNGLCVDRWSIVWRNEIDRGFAGDAEARRKAMNEGQTHWESCWQDHHACARIRIAELESQLTEYDARWKLRNEYIDGLQDKLAAEEKRLEKPDAPPTPGKREDWDRYYHNCIEWWERTLAEYKKDAERYRWLRRVKPWVAPVVVIDSADFPDDTVCYCAGELDDVLDAAIGSQTNSSVKRQRCASGSCSMYRNMNGGCDVCGAPCL